MPIPVRRNVLERASQDGKIQHSPHVGCSAERTVEQGASHSRGIAGTVSWQTVSSGRSFQPVNLLDKLASHDVPVDERVLIALELEEQFPLRLTPLSEKD